MSCRREVLEQGRILCLVRQLRTVLGWSAWPITVRDPLSDLIIPLLLGTAPQETNHDHGHVVTTNTTSLGVGSQAVVHHVFADLIQVLLGSNATANKLGNSLRGLAIPDTYVSRQGLVRVTTVGWAGDCGAKRTITGNHQELVIVGKVMYHDVGVGGHNLLLRSKLGALLELEVADGSGESEVAVDSSEVDEATSRGDSRLLAWE